MPISPPSQIGMELMRAPALADIHAARSDLARRSEAAATDQFSVETGDAGKAGDTAAKKGSPESFRKFEAMVLQTFIQNMLPKDGAAVYGKGMAGDMWKSLMAEKMAQVMAERGGIGIAGRMLGQYSAAGGASAKAATGAQIPQIESKPDAGERLGIAPAILDSMQRSLSDLLTDDLRQSPGDLASTITQRG
ncbi:MAG: rod-binding protein [Hyphomicrobiales bacterium]|nr:rod-binding protein [Hyphomicrobiales bacterium]